MRTAITTLLFLLMLCGSAPADQVTLKNGDRLTGAIVRADKENLVLETEYAGRVTVETAAIAEIVSQEPIFVVLEDGQVLRGRVQAVEDTIHVESATAGRVELPREQVEAIRSPEEHALEQAWTGFLDSGLSLSRGNADTSNLSIALEASRATARDKVALHFVSLFAQGELDDVTLTTARALRGGVRYDFNLGERTFAFGLVNLEHDAFQQLDLRNVLGAGLGYQLRRTARTTFDLFAGGAFNQEFFAAEPTRRSGEALFGNDLTYTISDRTQFTQRLEFFPNVSDLGEFRLVLDGALSTRLNQWLGWQAKVSNRFVSNPVPGTQRNDVLLTTGLRLVFGRGQL